MQEEEEAVAAGRSSKAGNQICSLLSNREITDDLGERLRREGECGRVEQAGNAGRSHLSLGLHRRRGGVGQED